MGKVALMAADCLRRCWPALGAVFLLLDPLAGGLTPIPEAAWSLVRLEGSGVACSSWGRVRPLTSTAISRTVRLEPLSGS